LTALIGLVDILSMKTAIVILNWNGKKYLERFLPSVIENSSIEGVEIIIADNASTDDSLIFLKTNFPKIRLIILDKNYGFAEGYNKALFQINADYFVLLNSDVEVTPNWLEPNIKLLESDNLIAVCQPKIVSFSQKDSFEYAGAAGGFIDKFGFPFCRGRIISKVEKDEGQYDDVKEVFWATGACLFVKAEIYKKSGGLDPLFFAHMEEIDFCWRLKNNGYKIFYNSDSKVYHVGGGTLPNNNPYKLFLNYRNNLLLLYKNLPHSKLFFSIFTRLIFDGLSAIIYLVSFKFSFFAAVFKAHLAFYQMKKKYFAYRKNTTEINKFNYKEVFQKSIVFNFFLLKKKTFNLLKFKI
jgi:GT2 family glycosyltransferase